MNIFLFLGCVHVGAFLFCFENFPFFFFFFVDASSEYLSVVDQADTDDAARAMMQAVSGSRSQTSQLAVIGGSFQSLSPMIIMNNVLLKQVKSTFARNTVPQPP